MKKHIPIALIAAGAVLIVLPATYSFVLRLRDSAETLSPIEMAACQYGGFSLVAGAILLALLLPEKRGVEPAVPAIKPASAPHSPDPAGQTPPTGG